MTCAGCRADLGPALRVGRRDTCPRCGADLHTCRNCRFYDPRAYNECAEPQAERVLDKNRSNFCDFFALATTDAAGASAGPAASGEAAHHALDRLFRRH